MKKILLAIAACLICSVPAQAGCGLFSGDGLIGRVRHNHLARVESRQAARTASRAAPQRLPVGPAVAPQASKAKASGCANGQCPLQK